MCVRGVLARRRHLVEYCPVEGAVATFIVEAV